MYRICIFCSADLKANDALERFPVGRSIAFDSEKGRLWAVCPACARWNLAPIEERWEAIEDAERLFRDTRTRVQSENIGLAKLRDGTRLVRIGQALDGELAAWRYGREMRRRQQRKRVGVGVSLALSAGTLGAWLMGPAGIFVGLAASQVSAVHTFYSEIQKSRRADHVAHRFPGESSPTGLPMTLRWRDLAFVTTAWNPEHGLELRLKQAREVWAGSSPLVLTGPAATAVLGKAMVRINHSGAGSKALDGALDRLARADGAASFLRHALAPGYGLGIPGLEYDGRYTRSRMQVLSRGREATTPLATWIGDDSVGALAVEMALHEETERRALDGELAALEEMWRQAEAIAAIADRLPDVPAADPPRT